MIDTWGKLLERPEIPVDRDRLRPLLAGRCIAITGAGGSIGTGLSQFISTFGPERLLLIDSHEASLVRLRQQLQSLPNPPAADFILADLRDRRKLDQCLRRQPCQIVFHLAAYKQVPLSEANVDQVIAVNVLGTLNVVEVAGERGIETVVYPSTDKAVNPSGVYGATKRVVERVLQALSQTWASSLRVVRLVNVFGTQGSVVEVFARQIAANEPIGITDLAMDRYWITMTEATYLLTVVASRPSFEGIYYLDSGDPVPLIQTARRVNELLRPGQADPPTNLIGIRPGERLHEQLQYANERRRATDVAGLLTLELPATAIPASDWLAELRAVQRDLDNVEPSDLRSWLFAAIEADDLASELTHRRPARKDAP